MLLPIRVLYHCLINIMTDILPTSLPLIETPANRFIFSNGEPFTDFYQLLEGEIQLKIYSTAIDLIAPAVIGDYEIQANLAYRFTQARTLTKCLLRKIPVSKYEIVAKKYLMIGRQMTSLGIESNVLKYWLKACMRVKQCMRNDKVGEENALGIVFEGAFRIDEEIPIVQERRTKLTRRFEICVLGQSEVFVGEATCQTPRGTAAVIQMRYVNQLAYHYDEFKAIMELADVKNRLHVGLKQEIKETCQKKSSLFRKMAPLPYRHSMHTQNISKLYSPRPQQHQTQRLKSLKKQADEFALRDSVSIFLHRKPKPSGSMMKEKQKRFSQIVRQKSKERIKKRPKYEHNLTQVQSQQIVTLRDYRKNTQTRLPSPQKKSTARYHNLQQRLRTEPNQPYFPKVLMIQ